MTQEQWQVVDDYIAGLFGADDPALAAALHDSTAAGLPQIAVTATLGRLLHLLARTVGARRILEIGTLGGYSAIWLARALPPDGRLITLEFDPVHAEMAQTNIARAGLADRVEVRVGRAVDSLAALDAEATEPFDLIFIDADKPSYPAYLHWSLRHARPGALIVADNVVRQGRVADAADDDANVRGVRQFNAALAAEPRLTATILQTVDGKGYDGVAIAVVNSK
ncbi:O-methyltransferase family 3 [Candidatus Promineifilum breve]|uniref:O-methyltransferase family 3 n=1 Tax=Candidatus Promineifilum breve TaxID=1806508 RepID=A0A160T2A8_9CHLR|nr:O-methyltransferase [Candidatus Promineifilum breve]CUS03349.2 O-methyltransferase family 3 [Candidatus Promineifilum breve]